MNNYKSILIAVFSFAVAVGNVAATPTDVVVRKPLVPAAKTINVAATVVAVDSASRAVTLTSANGKELSVIAGSQVKNLTRLKAGDIVDVKYVLPVAVAKGDQFEPTYIKPVAVKVSPQQ